jgi:hypothetical protein
MIIITLICYYADNVWKTIIQALIIVLVVKMVVSPHSMISAYFAVSFQAILGGFLYHYLGINKITTILLASLGLVESALQKIVSLTILFGKSIWEAIDALGDWVSKNLGYLIPFDSSNAVIISYVTLYACVGIILGYQIQKLVIKIKNTTDIDAYTIDVIKIESANPQRRKKGKWRFIAVSVILASLIILILYSTDNLNNSYSQAANILIRTLLIIGIWYMLIAPILLRYVKKFLSSKNSQLSAEVDQVFAIIPYMRYIVSYAWKNSNGLSDFIYKCIMYTLHFKSPKP